MRHAVLSLLLAFEPEQGFFESGCCVRFLRSRSFQKSSAEAMIFLFVCAIHWLEAIRAGASVSLALSLAASMAPMAQSGGDGRWRHRAQAYFLVALLYSRAP